jgi:hypothetical protein
MLSAGVFTPNLLVNRSRFPNADGEYTPAQRRMIDARLAKADADIRAGRASRVFSEHREFIAALRKEVVNPITRKNKRPPK